MEIKGVLDRITDGEYGTIIAEEINQEFVLNIRALPKGSKEGMWFDLIVENGELKSLTINQELTDERKSSIAVKMAKLKKRSGSKFKK